MTMSGLTASSKTTTNATLAGLVLCGGQSQRMGRPKALLPWQGQTLVEVIVGRLRPICQPIVIAASPEMVLPDFPHDIMVRDDVAYEGPLAGLAQAISGVPPDRAAVFVTACDVPFLQTVVIQRLWEIFQTVSRKGSCDAVVVREPDGRWHPLLAIYRRDVELKARGLHAKGCRRMQDLLNALQVRPVETAELIDIDRDLLCLRNVNGPAEFQEAQRLAEQTISPHPDPSPLPAGGPATLPPETESP